MAEQGGDAAANTREVRDPVWERCPRAQLRQVGAFPRALSRLESEHRVCPAWAYESLRPKVPKCPKCGCDLAILGRHYPQ